MTIVASQESSIISLSDSNATPAPTLEFRKDINGLRAFAVIAVVLYHFGIGGLKGGFSGVDVFFVISGFLMTGIIITRLEKGTFNLWEFYLSRARRIIPALAVLCAFLLAWGYFWLVPSDYKTLGEHASAAIAFVSNFVFKGEEGYFDAPMRDKWLLHTWSLSVEWQFYLIYPVFLTALYKVKNFSRHRLCVIFAALAILTLIGSAIISPIKPSFSFYLLPTRVWEFMAGGIAWLLSQNHLLTSRLRKALEIIGILFLISSFFIFDSDATWPGYVAGLPVLGTFLVILAAQNSLFTSNTFAQVTGKWSYSIYLWHWPVFVSLGYFNFNSTIFTIAAIIVSFLLGGLSYALVEMPFRKKAALWSRTISNSALACSVLAVCVFGASIYQFQGIPSRVSQEIQRVDLAVEDRYRTPKHCGFNRDKETLSRCVLGDKNEAPAFVLWGDSHVGSIASAVLAASAKKSGLIYSFICPTIFNAHVKAKAKDSCPKFNHLVLQDVQSLPKSVPVIIANRFSYYLHGLNEGIKRVHGLTYVDISDSGNEMDEVGIFKNRLINSLCTIAQERKVYVLKPVPEMGKNVPKTMARSLMTGTGDPEVSISIEEYYKRNNDVFDALYTASSKCGITLLDPLPYLCANEKCSGVDKGSPIFFDDDHLNETGNKKLTPLFETIFR